MKNVTKAVSSFKDTKFNCSQAIFSTYGPIYGIPRESCLKIGENFGGGVAYLGNTCGAVTGALMAIGAKTGREKHDDSMSKEISNQLATQFIDKFKSRNGTIMCKELIKFDISTEERRKIARQKKIFDNCPIFIKDAAEILEELLKPDD